MLAKLRERLAALAKALGIQKALLARARRRYATFHKRAFRAMKQKESAWEAADKLRSDGHDAKARRKDKKAGRFERVEVRNRTRKHFWLGRVKILARRVKGIKVEISDVEAELAEWIKTHGVQIKGNKATGGTPGKRWLAVWAAMVINCSRATRRNFYSQSGSPSIRHEIEPGPSYGCRSDCSSTLTGAAWSANLPDPNGNRFNGEGFTGTLIGEHNGWRGCSLAELREKGWGYIVYGSGDGHHTEAFTPSKSDPDRTSGHGSSPVDHGTLHLFGAGEVERYYIFDPK